MAAVRTMSAELQQAVSEFATAQREHIRRIVREEIADALGQVAVRGAYSEEDVD